MLANDSRFDARFDLWFDVARGPGDARARRGGPR